MDLQRRDEFLQYVTQRNTFEVPITLLHCSSEYPSTINDYAPKRFLSQLAKFPTVIPGISDHTLDNSLIAYTSGLGFSFFEKHIKLSTDNTSIDSSFSADVNYLGKLQEWLDKTSENTSICESSRVANVFQRACYWRHSFNQNDVVTRDMIIFRRILFPQGVTPDHLSDVLGKKLLNSVMAGDPLLASDFC